jgi:hypothetical protein
VPSPLLSSLLKTSSAAAVLVPPAPSAFSNSDLVISPSPLPSICENRFCSASAGLVEADTLADAVVDVELEAWLCAASSACIVAGEICEPPPVKPVVPLELEPVEVCSRLDKSNPVDDADVVAEEVSDWIALAAVDAAPKANSMVKLRYTPPDAAQPYMQVKVSKRRAIAKSQEPYRFRLNRNGGLIFCFDAFSSREPVPMELVIGRAFARPVGSKTLRRGFLRAGQVGIPGN